MPKKKTRKTASKKFRLNKGGIKRAQANTSHNTGKMRPKRKRRIQKITMVDKSDSKTVRVMLPNLGGH
ncbi:MAG: 50S ribosomal protein L35 [Bdellovibrionota bacterium]